MRVLIVLLLSAFCLQLSAFADPPPYPASADIQAIVNQINADSLRDNVTHLQNFFTRHTYSDTLSDSVGIGAAIRWVQAKAESYGPQRSLWRDFPMRRPGTANR